MTEKNYLTYILFGVFGFAILVLIHSSAPQAGERLVDTIAKEAVAVVPTPPEELTKLDKIETEMAALFDIIPAHMTFILRDLKSGEVLEMNNDRNYVSASLYKLFIAYYAYDQIDKGLLSLNTVIEDRTVDSCLDDMITVSDNECGVALGDYFGWTNVTNMIQANGFSDTVIVRTEEPGSEFITTPSDIESFLNRLHSGELLNNPNTDHLIDLLLRQQINDRLPLAIPSATVIAHKTGDVYNYIHDAGIIYTDDGDYSFVMMSSQWGEHMLYGPGYDYFKAMFNVIFYNI